jgi:hypothetical protein
MKGQEKSLSLGTDPIFRRQGIRMGGSAARPTDFLFAPLRLCALTGPFFFVLSFAPLASTPRGTGLRARVIRPCVVSRVSAGDGQV